VDSQGEDVQILVEAEEGTEETTEEIPSTDDNCHFHAGVQYVLDLPPLLTDL
jgi:hypothetical protein